MNAKVKDSNTWKSIRAFGGHEYTKGEWRPVPPANEDEARIHPFLEVEDEAAVMPPIPDNLDGLTKSELVTLGTALGLGVSMVMRKDELIAAITQADLANDEEE